MGLVKAVAVAVGLKEGNVCGPYSIATHCHCHSFHVLHKPCIGVKVNLVPFQLGRKSGEWNANLLC